MAEPTPEPIADWWPGDDRPLVYMTFGSVAASVPMAAAAYPVALDSIASLDVRVLLSTGQGIDDLVAPSPNVHVEPWVSNEPDVIAEAAVVVSHGGFGTTLAVLASGTPLVFVPLFADQPFNAARVVSAGSGIVSTPAASGRSGATPARRRPLRGTSRRDRRRDAPLPADRPRPCRTRMSDAPADHADEQRRLSVALSAAFARFEDLLAQAGAPETPIKNSTWTVSDLAAHVAAGLEAYAR